jgi:uncharacterized protein (DUF58 family)
MAALVILILLIPAYIFLRRYGITQVEYKRYFSEDGVFEGGTVFLIEEVTNRFFLPLFLVDVDVCLNTHLHLEGWPKKDEGMQQFTSRFYLPPFMRVKRSIEVTCEKRGYYELDSVSVNGITIKSKAVLYVYPRAFPYGKSSPMENEMQSTAFTNRRLLQDPFSFSGIRDYRHGDPFRSINYKATAKTGVVKVNNRDFFSSRNIMIYIDFGQQYPHPLSTPAYIALMERALSYSADMVWNSIQQGFSVGFAANCRTFGPRGTLAKNHIRFPMARGNSHYMEILKIMATIRMTDGCSFIWLLKHELDLLWNVDIYIMTTNTSQPLDEITNLYKSRGNHVTILELEEDERDEKNLA